MIFDDILPFLCMFVTPLLLYFICLVVAEWWNYDKKFNPTKAWIHINFDGDIQRFLFQNQTILVKDRMGEYEIGTDFQFDDNKKLYCMKRRDGTYKYFYVNDSIDVIVLK